MTSFLTEEHQCQLHARMEDVPKRILVKGDAKPN